MNRFFFLTILCCAIGTLQAQQPSQDAAPAAQTTQPDAPQQPHGEVLFERHAGDAVPQTAAATQPAPVTESAAGIDDAKRDALTVTRYDLDARFTLATGSLAMRALLGVRNDSAQPLTQIALQISSTLDWKSATLVDGSVRTPLVLAQHTIDTDADHTGAAREAIITLPAPLAPHAAITLDTFYAGTLAESGERLTRVGASREAAADSEWDAVDAAGVRLRGFGDVLWFPVAAAQVFLGDGAALVDAAGRMKAREAAASVALRLTVETVGEPPVAAYFCGRRAALHSAADDRDQLVVEATTLATADFPAAPLGVRALSLFTIAQPEALAGTLPGGQTKLLAIEGADAATTAALAAGAQRLAPFLQQWLGVTPETALTLIDQPGQPYEDGPLLVAPLTVIAQQSGGEAMLHGLTHAWFFTGQPWFDEGLATFLALKWTEREHGRDAMLRQFAELEQPLMLAEPAPTAAELAATPPEGSLQNAIGEVYTRRKAAAVFLMIDDVAGDEAMQHALDQLRAQLLEHPSTARLDADFLAALPKPDLTWLFADWVMHDKGLPDLSLRDVNVSPLPAAPGHAAGYIITVTATNAGGAAADVPLTVHAQGYDKTERMRLPAFSSATTRIVVEGLPRSVTLNDGSVLEQQAMSHTRLLSS